MKHSLKIKQNLESFDLNQIARDTKFAQRNSGKISPINFLLSFLLGFTKPYFSFRQWAIEFSLLTNKSLSFQALSKRCNEKCLAFMTKVIEQVIDNQLFDSSFEATVSNLSTKFNRILIQDSTTFNLSKSMLDVYGGAGNDKSYVAMMKVHLCFDLLTMKYQEFKLSVINKNDASYASAILHKLQVNDLVLRDMGYLSCEILKIISQSSAFFISRLKSNFIFFEPNSEQEFDIVKALKKLDRRGQKKFVMNLTVGNKKELTTTIIAVKLSPKQIKARNKKYNRKRSKSQKINKRTKYLNTWSLLATNIDLQEVAIEQIYDLYAFRWQVELIFKCWKSRLNLDEILENYTGGNKQTLHILFYMSMLFVLIVYLPMYIKWNKLMRHKYNKTVSMQKFASIIKNHVQLLYDSGENLESLILRFGCIDKRNDRLNSNQIQFNMVF